MLPECETCELLKSILLFLFSLSNLNPHPPTQIKCLDLGGRLRIEVGHKNTKPGPQRRIGSIGGIGPKKGSMAKIGKGQKRAPETP